ncbi:MAG TPA: hypothetical protein VKD72_04365 [Gemmataceae bacterium]|nr:hypothetical protein [Gemmataceae bacterium]
MADKTNGQVATGAQKPITKMEAVRRAWRALGKDAKPAQMKGFIKNRFGIDMTTDHISTCKGEIRRKKAARKKQAVTKTAPAQPPAKGAPVPSGKSGSGSISIADIQAVKDLVRRVGAGELRTLIDLFAK